MLVYLFGSTTNVGHAFVQHFINQNIFTLMSFTRRPSCHQPNQYYCDLSDYTSFQSPANGKPFVIVSFAPIWIFASFLESVSDLIPGELNGLQGIVCCSSSSVTTKRFSFADSDRILSSRLLSAENIVSNVCLSKDVPCTILRPSIIYGISGPFVDKNISLITHLLRFLPCLILPRNCGLRQPIHAHQLASVAAQILCRYYDERLTSFVDDRLFVGGDITLPYDKMISALQDSLSFEDPGRFCFLFLVPNRLFYIFSLPVLIFSPKYFASLLRISSDLSGFTPSYQLLGRNPQSFPFNPNV